MSIELFGKKYSISRKTKLNLSKKRLTILHDDIGKLIYLKELNLFKNNLTCLPNSIGNLDQLTKLNLQPKPFLNLTGFISRDIFFLV